MIIYIAGYGRSGSTLLDIVLANSENVSTLGEIGKIVSERTIITNKFYADILFRTIESLKLSEKELNEIALADRSFNRFNSKYKDFWTLFLENSKIEQEKSIFVDSSKTTWHTLFRPSNLSKTGFEVKIIFLKASYKKVWKSALKGSNSSLQDSTSTPKKLYFFAFRTLVSKFFTDLLTNMLYNNKSHKLIKVNYVNFTDDPENTLKSISDKLEIDFKNLDDKIANNQFLVKGGYSGNRLRKEGTVIKIKKSDK